MSYPVSNLVTADYPGGIQDFDPSGGSNVLGPYPLVTISASGTAVLQNASNLSVLDVTLTNNTTLTLTSIPAGAWSFKLISRQDSTGGWNWSWPANTTWDLGSAPTQTTTSLSVDVYEFLTVDQGAHWLARRLISSQIATLLRDTVARADSASSAGTTDTGQSWSALTGTWGVASNKLYRVGTGTTDSILSIDVGAAWSRYSASIKTSSEYPGLAFDITDASNFYMVISADVSGGVWAGAVQLYKCVSGSYTKLADNTNAPSNTGAETSFEIRRNASTRQINVYINSSLGITITDTSLATTNKVGLRFQTNLSTNTARWSNLTVV